MASGSVAKRGGWLRWLLLLALAALLLATTSAASSATDGSRRALRQVPPPLPSTAASARPAQNATYVFPSLFDALNAAGESAGESAKPSAANLTILVAAVRRAGVINSSLPPGTAWTIFAPTNKAFERKLPRLGLTPAMLLANSSLLTQILSYHVVPGGAYNSSSLTQGTLLTTALAGAPPLVVKVDSTNKDGSARETPQIEIQGVSNKAEVSVPDVFAGRSVVHIINDVLLPPGISAALKRATGRQAPRRF